MKQLLRGARRAGLCLGLWVLVGLAGCVSPPSRGTDELHLTLTSVGTVVMDGAVVRRPDLPRALRSAGAGPATPIVVSTATTTPMTAISALTSQLATAGYRCVVFRRPRHADASAGAPAVR